MGGGAVHVDGGGVHAGIIDHGAGFHPEGTAFRGGERGHFRDGGHIDFHGHDFGHFSDSERHMWEGGAWHHDWHLGRFGWWWIVDNDWYFYPEPIYPYPTYVPPVADEIAPPAPAGLPQANWYYCDNPTGYYPYVASCLGAWRAVPTAPPAQSPVATAPVSSQG